MNFTNIDTPIEWSKDPELGYENPHSKIVFLVLFLYSIEPPLYFALNDACRKKDKLLLPMLGPFAQALYWVLEGTERGRKDRFTKGELLHNPRKDIHHPLGYMSGCKLVFRGALLPPNILSQFAL